MPSAHPLIDHQEIRRWAEARRARPSCVRRTGGKGDPGMIRLDFPGFSGRESLSPISWDEWFKAFDENDLALMVQDRTARGQQSNFNKLVSRQSITEGPPPRRERKREQRGSSRARGAAAERKTTGRKTSGRGASSRGAKSASRSRTSSRSGSTRSSRKTSSSRGGSSSSGGQSARRSSSSSSRSKANDSSRSSNSRSRTRRPPRTPTRGGNR